MKNDKGQALDLETEGAYNIYEGRKKCQTCRISEKTGMNWKGSKRS